MNSNINNDGRVICRMCRYFFITWNASFPYGCKAYGFKSKQIPDLFVFQSSGAKCKCFEKKN